MRTHREIAAEARRVETLAQRHRDERIRSASAESGVSEQTVNSARWVLFDFPKSHIRSYHDGTDSVDVRVDRVSRRVEAGLNAGALHYYLIKEIEPTPRTSGESHAASFTEFESNSAEDVLLNGYELAEEERLLESLMPVVARLEEVGFSEGMHAAVEEIEELVGARELPAAERLRAKAEILGFLEGRLDRSSFITAAIDRWQECAARSETITRCAGERILIDQP